MRDLLLITSNVGSLFGDRSGIRKVWLERLVGEVHVLPASLICVNLQETGGKNYKVHSGEVAPLIDDLHQQLQPLGYHFCRTYLDTEWEHMEEYTALSSIIFLHDTALASTAQWNFAEREFRPVASLPEPSGRLVVTHRLWTNEWVRKEKFSRDFWPTFRWGRKGYLHTRWRVGGGDGGRVVDLLNVHLFHDESNLTFLNNPCEYSDNRRNALLHVLRTTVSPEEMLSNCLFLFGDFNFRLDYRSFVKKLTRQSTESIIEDEELLPNGARASTGGESSSESEPPSLQNSATALQLKMADAVLHCAEVPILEGEESTMAGEVEVKRALTRRRKSSVVEYRRGSVNVLRIAKKRFEFSDPQQLIENWCEYRDDDRELCNYRELRELPINFPPTYPWSEDATRPNTLMSTRGPAWCDRVVMNEKAFDDVEEGSAVYRSFAKDVCIGDHKPVLLAATLKKAGDSRTTAATDTTTAAR